MAFRPQELKMAIQPIMTKQNEPKFDPADLDGTSISNSDAKIIKRLWDGGKTSLVEICKLTWNSSSYEHPYSFAQRRDFPELSKLPIAQSEKAEVVRRSDGRLDNTISVITKYEDIVNRWMYRIHDIISFLKLDISQNDLVVYRNCLLSNPEKVAQNQIVLAVKQ